MEVMELAATRQLIRWLTVRGFDFDPLPSLDYLLHERMAVDRRTLLASMQDKVNTPRYAATANISVAHRYLVTSNCAAVSSNGLPPDFVFKATHTSGCVLIVKQGRVVIHKPCLSEASEVGAEASTALLVTLCERWLSHRYESVRPKEWAYSQLVGGVLAEEVLQPPLMDGVAADDLKCYTVYGRTLFVQHSRARFGADGAVSRSGTATFYDATTLAPRLDVRFDSGWHGMGAWVGMGSQPDRNASRWAGSRTIEQAVRACDRIASAAAIDFVRVDLLFSRPTKHHPAGLTLGELTIYPFGGYPRFTPRSVDAQFAAAWCAGGGPYWSHTAQNVASGRLAPLAAGDQNQNMRRSQKEKPWEKQAQRRAVRDIDTPR